jgi:hypothetical protein
MCNILEIEEVLDFTDEDREFDLDPKFKVILKRSKNPFLNYFWKYQRLKINSA